MLELDQYLWHLNLNLKNAALVTSHLFFHWQRLQFIFPKAIPVRWYDYLLTAAYFRLNNALFFPSRPAIMDAAKAEAENIEPSAGKELLDKYWSEAKTEIDDINIVSTVPELAHRAMDQIMNGGDALSRWNFVRPIFLWLVSKRSWNWMTMWKWSAPKCLYSLPKLPNYLFKN